MSEIAACTLIQEEPDRKTERYMMMFKDYKGRLAANRKEHHYDKCGRTFKRTKRYVSDDSELERHKWKAQNQVHRTGLPVKGNKKRAESLLRKTQKEFNPETMQQVSDLPVSEYLNRWLRESVMNLPPETYGRYAYDLGRVVVPYFEKKRLSLKALSPRDLETFFRYERQQEEASVQQLLDWHKELTDALQYAVDNNWLKVSPIKEVDPCLDNSPVLFTDFITDWLKMMKSRVEITTYTSYERAIIHKIVPYFEPLHYTLQDMEQHPKYIQDFYQHELDRGLTANTVIHYHANIRKCLQYAFQIGMIRSNPADRVERPRKEKFKSEMQTRWESGFGPTF